HRLPLQHRDRLQFRRLRDADLAMIDLQSQLRHQRALDVAHHLLGQHRGVGQHVHFLDLAAATRHDPRRENARQRADQFFGPPHRPRRRRFFWHRRWIYHQTVLLVTRPHRSPDASACADTPSSTGAASPAERPAAPSPASADWAPAPSPRVPCAPRSETRTPEDQGGLGRSFSLSRCPVITWARAGPKNRFRPGGYYWTEIVFCQGFPPCHL